MCICVIWLACSPHPDSCFLEWCFPLWSLGAPCRLSVFAMWCSITCSLLDFTPWPRLLQLESPCIFLLGILWWQGFYPYIECVSSGSLVDLPRAASHWQRVCNLSALRQIFCICFFNTPSHPFCIRSFPLLQNHPSDWQSPKLAHDTSPALSVTVPSLITTFEMAADTLTLTHHHFYTSLQPNYCILHTSYLCSLASMWLLEVSIVLPRLKTSIFDKCAIVGAKKIVKMWKYLRRWKSQKTKGSFNGDKPSG